MRKARLLGVCSCLVLLCGCVGPHYTSRQLVICGKPAPPIAGPDDPQIPANLRAEPDPRVNLLAIVTGFFTTPLKCFGVQGWKDYHCHAQARGTVVQHQVSTDNFLTVDVRLISLAIDGVAIPLSDPKFIRLEIYPGSAPAETSLVTNQNAVIVAEGRFVWDTDGWFEIHPQTPDDVRAEPKPDASPVEIPR
jgi:hypothetical protein